MVRNHSKYPNHPENSDEIQPSPNTVITVSLESFTVQTPWLQLTLLLLMMCYVQKQISNHTSCLLNVIYWIYCTVFKFMELKSGHWWQEKLILCVYQNIKTSNLWHCEPQKAFITLLTPEEPGCKTALTSSDHLISHTCHM